MFVSFQIRYVNSCWVAHQFVNSAKRDLIAWSGLVRHCCLAVNYMWRKHQKRENVVLSFIK
jgi:hypothetical protein